MEIDALLGAIVAPVAITAALVFALRLLRGRFQWCASTRVPGAALSIIVVWAAAHQSMGLISWPRIALEWFPWAVIAGGLVACALGENALRFMGRRSGSAAAALAVVVGLAFLKPPGVDLGVRVAWIACAAFAAALAAPALQAPGPSAAIALWGTAAALSGLALEASVAKLAVVLGAFSAGAAALAVISALQRPLALGAPGAAMWGIVIGGGAMLGLGYDESSLPKAVWWVAMASPAAVALALVPAVARRARLTIAMRACAPIAVAGAAAVTGVAAVNAGGSTPAKEQGADPYSTYGAAHAHPSSAASPPGAAPISLG